jgi:hypothetical protein
MSGLLILAGVTQLGIAAGSLAIPRVLRWREDTGRLTRLTRQVFWTYAGYIWGTNSCLGLVSLLAPAALLDGTPLARAVCGYAAAYWGVRLVLQFAWYDRSVAAGSVALRAAEAVLAGSFLFLTATYGYVAAGGR